MNVSIAQWSEHWYVKPEAFGSIPGWGIQITFRSRQLLSLILTSSSIQNLYIINSLLTLFTRFVRGKYLHLLYRTDHAPSPRGL